MCRECAEKIEDFTNFINKYLEISSKIRLLISSEKELSPDREEALDVKEEACEIEALDEEIEEILLPVEEKNEFCKDPESSLKIKALCFVCDICFKRYRSQNSLNRHVKTTHEKMRFSCSYCCSKFTQRSSLEEHFRNLHSDLSRSEVFPCTFNETCGRTFNTIKMLNQHLKCHNSDREKREKKSSDAGAEKKKYRKQCSICGLFFKHVEEHRLTHQSKLIIVQLKCEIFD